jgi:cytochrome oxidase Cu insertion factor (SCO1/SenC/PrrC family)
MLLFLFLFFAAPLIVVTVMHQLDWHPSGVSRGHMVLPVKPISMPAGIVDSDVNAISAELFKEKWSMVYIADQCDEVCMARLHDMRQIHASLSKHVPRVQRILITSSSDVSALKQEYPDLIVLNQSSAQHSELMQQFDVAGISAATGQRVYFADPLGFLMMSYPITSAASDIRKDLGRLLAYAWAG